MIKKIILISLIIIVSVFFLWTGFLWKIFSCGIAGSYPCVETWSLNVPENELIKIISEIKKEHPEIEPPHFSSTVSPRHDYWYDFDFYYGDTNEDVFTWSRPNDDTTCTTLALVAIASHIDSLTPISEIKMDRREINRDFGYFENKKQIRKFENKILDLIEEKIKNRQKK